MLAPPAPGIAGIASVGSGPGRRNADSFYVEDCHLAQTNTHAVQTLTGQISRIVGQLDTEKDFVSCRQWVDQAVKQASETQVILRRIQEHQRQAQNPAERSNRRMMYHKLSDNLAITARVLEDVMRRFTIEEQRHFSLNAQNAAAGGDAAGGDEECAIDPPVQNCPDFEAVKKRADEDMKCLQRIYSDLAVSVEDQQGASFEALENHMTMAGVADMERSTEEITMSRYNGERIFRRKVMTVGGTIIAVVGAVLFLTSG